MRFGKHELTGGSKAGKLEGSSKELNRHGGETETLRERQRKEKGRETQKGRETKRDFAGRLLHQRLSRQRPCHGGAASLPLLLALLSWASRVPA